MSERMEQAALRRVTTLVAGGAPPEAVFAAVAEEVGRLLGADLTIVGRYDPGCEATALGAWSSTGAPVPVPHTRTGLGGRNTATRVFRTRRPARIDDYTDASGPPSEIGRVWGFHSAVGVPISIEGRLWGVMTVASTSDRLLPADTEVRLVGFTELVATAIASAQARMELRDHAAEQAALRHVATLVARAAPPEEMFAAVTAEVGRLLDLEFTMMSRYEPDGVATVVGAWSSTDATPPAPVGSRFDLGGRDLHTLVFQTREPARIDDYSHASSAAADIAGTRGVHSAVGVPISVAGELWGVIGGASVRDEPLPADTEARLAGFTELVATAIANAEARLALRGFAEEQAALRRVATLVARAAPPEEVFATVTSEVRQLLDADFTSMDRYDETGAITVIGGLAKTGADFPVPIGTQVPLGGRNVHTQVFRTRRPSRVDGYDEDIGPGLRALRAAGVRSGVGVPVWVGGRLWGLIVVTSTRESLPADTEARLAGFTELVATALANAEAQAALAASRARIVAAADDARRRIERDLHDGAQQRLVSIALRLHGTVPSAVPPQAGELTAQLDEIAGEVGDVLDDLREIARGLHPAILAEGGLRPALKTLARRSAVPVTLDIHVDGRLPEPIELAAYYTVSETLTNTAKHARASHVDVQVEEDGTVLRICVRDDGCGGAVHTGGSGLVGLTDRVEALDGRLSVHSPQGAGTTVQVELPLGRPPHPRDTVPG